MDIPQWIILAKKHLGNRKALLQHLCEGNSLHTVLAISSTQLNEWEETAKNLLEKGKYKDSFDAYLFLTTLNPNEGKYWLGMGMAAQMNHLYETAIDAYEVGASCQPDQPDAYFYLAKCLFAIHDRDSALQALDIAITTSGEDPEYQEIKAQALFARQTLLRD